jgi:hypothetical protein
MTIELLVALKPLFVAVASIFAFLKALIEVYRHRHAKKSQRNNN